MPIEVSVLSTFTCSLNGCSTLPKVIGGNPNDAESIAEEAGWRIGTQVLGSTLDLCPTHAKELSEWMNDNA